MKKYITWERVMIMILLVVLGMQLFFTTKTKLENIALKLENQQLDSIKNTLGQTVLQQEAVIVKTDEERAYLKAYTDSLFQLTAKQEKRIKDIVAFYRASSNIVLRDKLVPYADTTGRKQWEDSVLAKKCESVIDYYETNYIKVPKIAVDTSSPYYKAQFTAQKTGINIDSISIPNQQILRFVTTKGGFLKRDVYGKRHFILGKRIEVQVINTNPLIHVTSQSSAIYQPPKKLRILEKAIYVAGGIYLGTKL